MKKYQILLLKIFNWLLLISLFLLSLKWGLSFILPRVRFEEEFKKIEEYLPLKEIKKEIIQNLPEESLKMSLKIESKKVPSFTFNLAIKENEIFFKVPFGWRKIEVGKENLKDFEKLIEILKERGIFEKFQRKNNEVEFLVNNEKLKEAIFEWKKDEKLREGISNLGDIGGKIFYNENREIEKIEIEMREGKIKIEFQNLKEKGESENLENLILSLLK